MVRLFISIFFIILFVPEQLVSLGVTDAVVLVTSGELRKYRAPRLLETYAAYDITAHHDPCTDGAAPTVSTVMHVLAAVMDLVLASRTVLIQSAQQTI